MIWGINYKREAREFHNLIVEGKKKIYKSLVNIVANCATSCMSHSDWGSGN